MTRARGRRAVRLLLVAAVVPLTGVASVLPSVRIADVAAPDRPGIEGSGARLGDVADPVAAERGRSGTDAWQLTRPASAGQIAGYLLRTDALPGTVVPLRVSTSAPRFRVEAFRFGWYTGGRARLVWRSAWTPGRQQPGPVMQPAELRTVTAPWQDSLPVPTAGWAPGAYLLRLTASTGEQSFVPYVVRSPSVVGRVVLAVPMVTWQAYNDWGGYSLYVGPAGDRRSWQVSFDRPYSGNGAADLLYGVRPVVERAERLGLPLAYVTDLDVDADPSALRGARAWVDLGHDEYWTPTMRQRVTAARDAGTNLAILGADTMYWRVRLAATAAGPRRAVVGYRTDAALDPERERDPAATTGAFRDAPAADPEESLTGLRYECYPVDADYRVADPGWWGFAGTGVRRGTAFGHLVGIEADRAYPVPGTPRPLQVLSSSPYSCGGVPTSAQSVYYTVPSGAGVFDAGTLRWTCAVARWCGRVTVSERTARFTSRVLDNILRVFAAGPAGRTHPARDTLGEFPLPAVNQVPAS